VSLREIVAQEIRKRGPIPFSRYMELCLYHPALGYYSRNAEQFGKAGDFYTSSDVHAVFGRLLARQFEEIWRALGATAQIEILELGAGRGLFAQDVLDWSENKFPMFFRALHYSLAERSPALRGKLKERLARFIERGRVSLPTRDERNDSIVNGMNGKGATALFANGHEIQRALGSEVPLLIFANEFFDALPVEILSDRGTLHISTADDRFVETWVPSSPEELNFIDRHGVHPEAGERVEVPLLAGRYMSNLAALIQRGAAIVIDYGYTRQQQLGGRHRGTLMTYRQHTASPNAYAVPGEQDITAHVNFTALTAAADGSGMQVQPLLTQSQFLMGIGEQNQFADVFADCGLPQERAKVALQLKHLVTPAGVGENFHVLVASKGVDARRVAGLSGLSFATSRIS